MIPSKRADFQNLGGKKLGILGRLTEMHFSLSLMTSNFHNLMFHLIDMVKAGGPLWRFSTLVLEAFNHLIVSCLHGTTRVEQSCLSQVLDLLSLEYLTRQVEDQDIVDSITNFDNRTNRVGCELPRGSKQIKVNGSTELCSTDTGSTIQHNAYHSVGTREPVDSSEVIDEAKFICSFDVLWRKGVLLQSVSKQSTERLCDSIICCYRGDPKDALFGEFQHFLLGKNQPGEGGGTLWQFCPFPVLHRC